MSRLRGGRGGAAVGNTYFDRRIEKEEEKEESWESEGMRASGVKSRTEKGGEETGKEEEEETNGNRQINVL